MAVALLAYTDAGTAAVDKINAAIQALNGVTDTSLPGVAASFSGVATSLSGVTASIGNANAALGQIQTFAAATNATNANVDTELRQLQAAASFLDTEDDKRIAEIGALQTAVSSASSMAAADRGVLTGRPGDAPQLYVAAIDGGDPTKLAAAPGPAVTVDTGAALQITGFGYVAPRAMVPVSPNRVYRARWAARRTTDTADPSAPTVRFGVAWYGADRSALAALTQTAAFDLPLTVAGGRQEALTVYALAGSVFTNVVAPAGACYARPFVQFFGSDQIGAVEELSIADITDAGLIAPDVDSLAARVAAVEAKLGITGVAA